MKESPLVKLFTEILMLAEKTEKYPPLTNILGDVLSVSPEQDVELQAAWKKYIDSGSYEDAKEFYLYGVGIKVKKMIATTPFYKLGSAKNAKSKKGKVFTWNSKPMKK